MRRLTLMIISVALALWAARLMAGEAPVAHYMVRDGLLLAIVAAIVFANQSMPPRRLYPAGVTYQWPTIGRALWGAGVASTTASALLFVVAAEGAFLVALRTGLWLIGLAAMLAGAFWRGPVRDFSPPSYRWQRDADGEFVRVPVEVSTPVRAEPSSTGYLSATAVFVGLIVLLAIGAYLRLRHLGSAMPCVAGECANALALVNGADAAVTHLFDPFWAVSNVMLAITDDPVISLRLTSATVGIGTLLFLFFALRRLLIPESALLGTWLLALSGWHVALSRTGQPASMVFFSVTVSLWALLHAVSSRDRRWWATAGLAFGVAGLAVPELAPGIWLWAVLASAINCVQQGRLVRTMLLLPATAIALSLPAFVEQPIGLAALSLHLVRWLQAATEQMDMSMLNWLTLALALLGVGYLLRFATRPATAMLLAGMLSLALVAIFIGDMDDASVWVTVTSLLPFAFVAGALTVDQLLRCTADTWRVLVRPAYFVAASVLLIAFLGVRSLDSSPVASSRGNALADNLEAAMVAYLSETLDGDTTIYVPPALLDSPQLQLQGADWLDSGELRPLTSMQAALFSGDMASTQRFLVSGVDRALLHLLQTYFPNSTVEPRFDEGGGQLLYQVFTVAPQDRVWPGLAGTYVSAVAAGEDASGNTVPSEPFLQSRDGPLSFDWSLQTGVDPPFVLTWQGSLSVPAAGAYTFTVDGVDGSDEDFTLLLDNQIVLASSLGVVEKRQVLAEGIYRLDMRYASGETPADLSIWWQRPDGITEVLPRAVLIDRPLPNLGLTGTYFAGEDFQPPAVSARKDLRFDPPSDLAHPYSVAWSGKLAANRAGEYLLALVGDGSGRLSINGERLVENVPTAEDQETGGYAEGVIYLEEGWHDIAIDYVPETPTSALQVLWQPPGSFAAILPAVYLTPMEGEIGPTDVALPPPPLLLDPRLGSETFALTQGVELRQAKIVRPPRELPLLSLQPLWKMDEACGDADGQLNWPHGVAIDDAAGRLFVADSGNRRVAVYDLDGNWLTAIESEQFEEPHDVDVTPDGRVFLLDAVGSPLWRVDVDGGVEPVLLDTGFYRPRGLDAAGAGVLAVADTGGGRIVLLTQDGATLAEYGGVESTVGKGQPVDVALTDRALWSVTAEDGRLWNLNTDGSMVAVEPTTTLDGPHLAALPDGAFFLTDPERKLLFHHRADGRPIAQFTFDDALGRPTGVDAAVIDGNTHVAVVDTARCTLSFWRTPYRTIVAD